MTSQRCRDRDRGLRGTAHGDQPRNNFAHGASGHVEDGRGRRIGDCAPVDILRQSAGARMASDEAHGFGMVAMGKRDAECRGQRNARRDARNDIISDPFALQNFDLLARPAKDHRVARFQADNAPSGLRQPDHRFVDLMLLAARAPGPFADQDALRFAARQLQYLVGNEIVEQESRGRLETSGFLFIGGIGNRDGYVSETSCIPDALVKGDGRLPIDESRHLIGNLARWRMDVDIGAGGNKKLGFPCGSVRATGDDGAFADKVHEDRQDTQRPDARRSCLTRLPGHDLHRLCSLSRSDMSRSWCRRAKWNRSRPDCSSRRRRPRPTG